MRLYLVRHAEAADPTGVWLLDEFRSLTRGGRRRFKRTARAFAHKGLHVGLLCTSPALRAVQTAELLAREVKDADVVVLDELRPGAAAIPLRDWLLAQRTESVALVGHRRQLQDLVLLLLGPHARVTLRKGEIACVDLRRGRARGQWALREEQQISLSA